jgi:hypothetical protein
VNLEDMLKAIEEQGLDGGVLPAGFQVEEVLKGLRAIAFIAWTYYSELIDLGFEAEQAMTLTVAYQESIIRTGTRG